MRLSRKEKLVNVYDSFDHFFKHLLFFIILYEACSVNIKRTTPVKLKNDAEKLYSGDGCTKYLTMPEIAANAKTEHITTRIKEYGELDGFDLFEIDLWMCDLDDHAVK